MFEAALRSLRKELRAFQNDGLESLRISLILGRTNPKEIPARGTWCGCPLSYRLGYRGSVREDHKGHYTNEFTLAWDGLEGYDYFDEEALLLEVESEIARRHRKTAHKRARKQVGANDKGEYVARMPAHQHRLQYQRAE